MSPRSQPHFNIKNKFQKRSDTYSDILTHEILRDICQRVTGQSRYRCTYDDEGYNKGRLALLEYNGVINYISLSEDGRVRGRNSFFQSVGTALAHYYLDTSTNKKLYFYFLPLTGSFETNYFKFLYRLMATAGFEFLNSEEYLGHEIEPFTTVQDVINQRNVNRERNRSNKSTYLTRGPENEIQIYAKTYGANKKESTILCIALSRIATSQIELFQISEQNLVVLPQPDLDAIELLGKVKVTTTDLTLERSAFEENDSLRSPTFIYNLFEKLGDKKCAFCGCEIPELVEGAHIWTVADIKKDRTLSYEQKIKLATDGDNGLWLCINHHKMLDVNLLRISENGNLKFRANIEENSIKFIKDVTPIAQIEKGIFTDKFTTYLRKRNRLIRGVQYSLLN